MQFHNNTDELISDGSNFEKIVSKILNEILIVQGIIIVRAKEANIKDAVKDNIIANKILDSLRMPTKKCDTAHMNELIEVNLVALSQNAASNSGWTLINFINCNVCFHGRHTDDAFWGLYTRVNSGIPFVVVTEDREIYRTNRSELGSSCEEATAARKLLEMHTDRIYLIKKYSNISDSQLISDIKIKKANANDKNIYIFDDEKTPHHTKYCRSVRPFDDLIGDIISWKQKDTISLNSN